MAGRGWYADWLDSAWADHDRGADVPQPDMSEVDEDGCLPDGSREDEPGPGAG